MAKNPSLSLSLRSLEHGVPLTKTYETPPAHDGFNADANPRMNFARLTRRILAQYGEEFKQVRKKTEKKASRKSEKK